MLIASSYSDCYHKVVKAVKVNLKLSKGHEGTEVK